MAKKKTTTSRSTPAPSSARYAPKGATAASKDVPSAYKRSGGFFSSHSIRETIESVAVAFILAFVFRTFEAEAFVIPTGSMAPTLMGQHKDIACPICGYRYAAGASSEDEQLAEQRGRPGSVQTIVEATCPLCRFPANVDPATQDGRNFPTYGGDRILVSKFNHDFKEPNRWDVIVFKYPGQAQMNYIKRLVGLPLETLRLWHGDLYIQPDGATESKIERRPPDKLRAMAQIVYDNDFVVDKMTDQGWPLRWQPLSADAAPRKPGWTTSDRGRSYAIEDKAGNGNAGETAWLRYQHFVPSLDDWRALEGGRVDAKQASPRLITDFYAYDSSLSHNQQVSLSQLLGLHWVGDLMLECELELTAPDGMAQLDLVKGGLHFGCAIDCQTGETKLSIDGRSDYRPTAKTNLHSPGSYHLTFANIDEQLTLWIDGEVVEFDAPTTYAALDNDRPSWTEQDPLDLAPAGIGARGASLKASHIRLWRDIYYIATSAAPPMGPPITDYPGTGTLVTKDYEALVRFWSTPAEWAPEGRVSPFDERRDAVFRLEANQFFMLGDNSPASMDARLWENERFVDRDLLVGKALLVFWPHSFNRIPGTSIPFPFFPNFARMGFIR